MIQQAPSKSPLLFSAGIVIVSLLSSPSSFSEERLDGRSDQQGSALELLNTEVLETVSLAQQMHFITPESMDTVVSPGAYRLAMSEPNRLKVIPPSSRREMIIDALPTHHSEDIPVPIALYMRDDEKFPHVVLLLAGGKGFQAVGSYDASRTRGLHSFQLSLIHIQNALKKKFHKQGK